MLKIHASYGKKVPANQEFSSRQFSASLEVELADEIAKNSQKLQENLTWIWNELKQAVERQLWEDLITSAGTSLLPEQGKNGTPALSNRAPQSVGVHFDTPRRATEKQIQFLINLAKRQGHDREALAKLVQSRFVKSSLNDLEMDEASALIEELKSPLAVSTGKNEPQNDN